MWSGVGALDCVLYFAPLINYLEATVIEAAAAPTEIIPKGLRITGDALAIFARGEGQWVFINEWWLRW